MSVFAGFVLVTVMFNDPQTDKLEAVTKYRFDYVRKEDCVNNHTKQIKVFLSNLEQNRVLSHVGNGNRVTVTTEAKCD